MATIRAESVRAAPRPTCAASSTTHDDEAGRLTCVAYDFKGNLLEKTRRVIARPRSCCRPSIPPPPDWQHRGLPCRLAGAERRCAGRCMPDRRYRTPRPTTRSTASRLLRYPQDVSGARKELRPHYNRAGALESVAHLTAHSTSSGSPTRQAPARADRLWQRPDDPLRLRPATFRLASAAHGALHHPDRQTYQPDRDAPLQDFAYDYDLAGNIRRSATARPAAACPNTPAGLDALDRAFGYDPLYRLLAAAAANTPPAGRPALAGSARCAGS